MREQSGRLDGAVSRGAGQWYAAQPEGTAPCRWVLAIHGSSRDALSYREVPFYRRQREIVFAQGLGFAAVSLGADVWGRREGLADVGRMADWLVVEGQQGPIALWASSAGGSLMFRYAQMHPERVAWMLGTFPVWDLEACAGLRSCAEAWSLPLGSAALAEALAMGNPARYAPPAQPLVLCQGLADQAVAPARHAEALLALRPALAHFTGDTHSINAWALYETPLIQDALRAYATGGIVHGSF